jgi:hypothetical protein
MENTPLDELLNDAQTAEPVEEQPVAEELVEQPRDENGRFAPKGVEESAPPAPDKLPQDVYEPLKAVRSENQALKDKLAQLEQAIQAQQNPPAPAPDMFETPEDWQAHFGGQVVNQATQQATFIANLNVSEMLTRREHKEDFDEMKALFLNLVEENPTLRQQALNDADPWEKAYQIAKTHKTMQQLGATDIPSLEQRIREQVMAEIQAQVPPVSRPAIPPTLSAEQNVGGRTGPAWTGPRPLNELLG